MSEPAILRRLRNWAWVRTKALLIQLMPRMTQKIKMKGSETFILSGVEAPSFAVIEKHIDDTFPIDCNFTVLPDF